MTRPNTLRELLRLIEERPDEAPPPPFGAADGQPFPAPRRPCRKHDERPVPRWAGSRRVLQRRTE
jgi:hypothetical protein